MNSNLFHNLLNIVFGIVGVLVVADWTAFGFDAATSVQIVGGLLVAQNALKLGINVSRDGIGGLIRHQPPRNL